MGGFPFGNRPKCGTAVRAHSLNGSSGPTLRAELIKQTRLHASRRKSGYFQLEEVLWRGREEDALESDSLPRQLAAPWKVSNVAW